MTRVRYLEMAIRDIEEHATPIGLADDADTEGNPRYYAVTVGALHRALGVLAGGIPDSYKAKNARTAQHE